MSETGLVVRQMTPSIWTMIQSMGGPMHEARLFGTGKPEQAMAIMIKGYELGLGLAASFEFIQIVEGKPSLSPRGMMALIHNSGEVEVKISETKDSCYVWMKRKAGFEYSVTWTMDDAKKAGVVKPNSGWDKYPANMLRWRALGFCADVVCPDLIGGLKRADEYGADIDTQGNVIEGQVWSVEMPATPMPATESTITLEELIAKYGVEAIMAASEGVIPGTLEELTEVAEKLAANG